MAWTEEMVETLKKLWDEGVTTGEIGRRLNISKNSIVGKVHRLGLSGRPSPIKKKSDKPAKEPTNKPDKPAKEKKTATKTTKPAAKTTTPAAKTTKEIKKETKPETTITPNINTPKPISTETQKIIPETPKSKIFSQITSDEEDIKLAKSINVSDTPVHKGENLSLVELDNHTCRWPIGDPKDENFHFCGKKIRLGQTYCEEHAAIAYVKPGKKYSEFKFKKKRK